LFCGHDSGTFVVGDGTEKKYLSFSGTCCATRHKRELLTRKLLWYFSIGKSTMDFRNKIAGFDYSSYFEI
jgi:hypothetical protein